MNRETEIILEEIAQKEEVCRTDSSVENLSELLSKYRIFIQQESAENDVAAYDAAAIDICRKAIDTAQKIYDLGNPDVLYSLYAWKFNLAMFWFNKGKVEDGKKIFDFIVKDSKKKINVVGLYGDEAILGIINLLIDISDTYCDSFREIDKAEKAWNSALKICAYASDYEHVAAMSKHAYKNFTLFNLKANRHEDTIANADECLKFIGSKDIKSLELQDAYDKLYMYIFKAESEHYLGKLGGFLNDYKTAISLLEEMMEREDMSKEEKEKLIESVFAYSDSWNTDVKTWATIKKEAMLKMLQN